MTTTEMAGSSFEYAPASPALSETVELWTLARKAAAAVHPYSHNSALILDGERDGTDIVRAAYNALATLHPPVEDAEEKAKAEALASEYAAKGDWNGAYHALRVALLNTAPVPSPLYGAGEVERLIIQGLLFLRSDLASHIERDRDGRMSSYMIRSGLLADILAALTPLPDTGNGEDQNDGGGR